MSDTSNTLANDVTTIKVTQGQRPKTLHAPSYCSAPFFIVWMIACMAWMPVSVANDDSATELSALPELPAQANHLGLSMVGHGRMTWLGFSIYRASLWTQNGTYQNGAYHQPPNQHLDSSMHTGYSNTLPIALHIVYEKNISSQTLVDTTLKEWRRLNIFNDGQRQFFAQQLRRLWPDVKPGDSITTVMNIYEQTIFLVNGREVGQISDKHFGTALLAIWLHPQTRATGLRADLIGL